MATAGRTAHAGQGPWITGGGWEYVLTLGAVGAGLAFTGPGKYSVDNALGLELSGVTWGLAALGLGLGAAAAGSPFASHPPQLPKAAAQTNDHSMTTYEPSTADNDQRQPTPCRAAPRRAA